MTIKRRSVLTAAATLGFGTSSSGADKSNDLKDLQELIDAAVEVGGIVRLPAGRFVTSGVKIGGTVTLQGIAGKTRLVSLSGGPILKVEDAGDVTLSGIVFESQNAAFTEVLSSSALVQAVGCKHLSVEACVFQDSPFNGLKLEKCSGRVAGNRFSGIGLSGLIALDSSGLEISGNTVSDIGNNGIQVWRTEVGEDGTLILNNRISRVKATSGGDGQNGNGINVFRAGNVSAANNVINDTAFSGIRFNSARNCQILGNSISRAGETALYVEFAFEGAVVANNIIEDVANGISITNYDQGGRLAICTGNIVRGARRGTTVNAGPGQGIHAEADTIISNNVVEDIETFGINLGWGQFAHNLTAQGNIIRNCARGITYSATPGAGKILIAGNMIENMSAASIQGMDHETSVTGDMTLPDAIPTANLTLGQNIVMG